MSDRRRSLTQLRNDMDVRDQKYYFLNKYICKKGDKTYKFTGYNCALEPCFQFDQDGEKECYYYCRGGWEMATAGGNLLSCYNDLNFNRPRKFLAPEINEMVIKYNDHILEELKYLSWKVFITDNRKNTEFKFICLCMNRIEVRLPPEMIFYILSFLKGYELLFFQEIIDMDETKNIEPFIFSLDSFPKIYQSII